ncbi:ABC transporter substrate-binding protein [Sedimentibacter saalensis]|jgi:multiple sugar transport system substrate-binding protein|uniref:ABC transporter substrate-binding protein n=2 Tax=Sedimentibacter TaxID=190972 RepID=UPI002896BBD6|nr:sugar ABC transporter substrate-binding protein [Sedimentibacter saalensis]MEA5096198.1 sugar ABC transporter substrate-binding protein [Sedimentibacter saalensis]
MKKLICIFLVLALTLSLTTACSSSAPETSKTPDTPVATEKPDDLKWDGYEASKGLSGKISFMHFGDDYERQMYADLIAAYEDLVPGVEVEQVYTPGDYYTKLQTLAASKTLPDIFWLSEGRVKEFADAGLMADLTDVLEKYPAISDGMFDGALDYGKADGIQYCIPKDYTSYVMYINVDMFKEAGIPIPTSDWTMDDYMKLSGELTKVANGRTTQYGTAVNNYRADWINFMGNYDAPWFKDGKSNISDPNAVKGLKVQADLIKNGYAPAPGTTGESEDRLFIIGQIAMYPSGRWVVPSFINECDFEWTAVEFPKGTTRVSPFITANVAINSQSSSKEIAANFLSFQLSQTGLGYTLSSGLSVPLYEELITDKNILAEPAEAFIATSNYIGDKEQVEALGTGKWSEYNSIISAELSLVFEGSQTIEQAAANIDKKANETLFK